LRPQRGAEVLHRFLGDLTAALPCDSTVLADDERALGPGGVCPVGRIFDLVDEYRDRDAELARRRSGDLPAFLQRLGLLDIRRLIVPLTAVRPGLANVDEKELRLFPVFEVELFQVADPVPKIPSGIGSEDDDDRALVPE
jgi:hypothetical protein